MAFCSKKSFFSRKIYQIRGILRGFLSIECEILTDHLERIDAMLKDTEQYRRPSIQHQRYEALR
jgi:hypothetical protein